MGSWPLHNFIAQFEGKSLWARELTPHRFTRFNICLGALQLIERCLLPFTVLKCWTLVSEHSFLLSIITIICQESSFPGNRALHSYRPT